MLLGAVLLIAIAAVTVAVTVTPTSRPRNVVQTRLYPFYNEAGERVGYLTPSISP